MALNAAMASGTAAVGFDYAAAAMHGRDGSNMRSVLCGEDEAFIAAALDLAGDAGARRRIAAQARTDMLGNAWIRVVDRFEELLGRTVEHSQQDTLGRLSA